MSYTVSYYVIHIQIQSVCVCMCVIIDSHELVSSGFPTRAFGQWVPAFPISSSRRLIMHSPNELLSEQIIL